MKFLLGVANWELYSKTEQYEKYVRNPSKAEKETGKYYPRLTRYNRHWSQSENIRIEFSASKLVYLNNVDELDNKDFSLVIGILQKRLETMGVLVMKSVLETASISSVHFSKNILLQNGYTANYLISEINKVNLRKSFDFTRSRYINDGQSLYAHTTSHQLVIYDKMADLKIDKKRAIDKEQSLYQRSLFDEIDKKKGLTEIIRFEVRLNHKQKLNKFLSELGYEKNPTFKQVFNKEMSKKVVTYYWENLIKGRNLGVFSITFSTKDILQTLLLANANLKPKQAIYLLGLFILTKDENGIRQLRTIFAHRARDRTWYRIAKDIKLASELITKNKVQDWVTQIDRGLEIFNSYKVEKNEKK
jgi:hypothetical protein